jgi:hypothetical protein
VQRVAEAGIGVQTDGQFAAAVAGPVGPELTGAGAEIDEVDGAD